MSERVGENWTLETKCIHLPLEKYPCLTGQGSHLYPSFPSSTTSCLNSSYIFLLKWSRRKNDQKRKSVFISCDWPIPSRFRSMIGWKERWRGRGYLKWQDQQLTIENKKISFTVGDHSAVFTDIWNDKVQEEEENMRVPFRQRRRYLW